jgi:hypothetical protein
MCLPRRRSTETAGIDGGRRRCWRPARSSRHGSAPVSLRRRESACQKRRIVARPLVAASCSVGTPTRPIEEGADNSGLQLRRCTGRRCSSAPSAAGRGDMAPAQHGESKGGALWLWGCFTPVNRATAGGAKLRRRRGGAAQGEAGWEKMRRLGHAGRPGPHPLKARTLRPGMWRTHAEGTGQRRRGLVVKHKDRGKGAALGPDGL